MSKYDPNTEIVQMRAQWKKAENCRKMWHGRWSWLLDEQTRVVEECRAVGAAPRKPKRLEIRAIRVRASLKPVPETTTGAIGWLAKKPEYALEIYTGWMLKLLVRAPDAWHAKDYVPHNERPPQPRAS